LPKLQLGTKDTGVEKIRNDTFSQNQNEKIAKKNNTVRKNI